MSEMSDDFGGLDEVVSLTYLQNNMTKNAHVAFYFYVWHVRENSDWHPGCHGNSNKYMGKVMKMSLVKTAKLLDSI